MSHSYQQAHPWDSCPRKTRDYHAEPSPVTTVQCQLSLPGSSGEAGLCCGGEVVFGASEAAAACWERIWEQKQGEFDSNKRDLVKQVGRLNAVDLQL